MDVTLTITMNAHGGITVSGPIANKMVAYAMLALARDEIQQFVPPVIAPATPQDILSLTRK